MRKTLETYVKKDLLGQELAQCGKKILAQKDLFLRKFQETQKLSKGPTRNLDPKSPLDFHIFLRSTTSSY